MGEEQEASMQTLDRPREQRAHGGARRRGDQRVGQDASDRGVLPDEGATHSGRENVPFGSRASMRFGAAVYGSFLVASVVGLAFEAGRDAREMTLSAFGSMLVFWLAHWWSEVVGARITAGETFRRRDALVIARREWPLVEAAVVPTLALALAWVGVWSRETGAALAMAAAIAQIVCWGFVAGRRAGATWLRAGLFAAVEGALGVVLLLLERLIH
ncbi:hypothetical protein FE374_03435 [Georgenia yuyongxinii]|uniref:Uncharacterized protein n=1 Tax=Georgenia yuyongxinii TaxID=2589797 RepID=A0A5B8BZF8_9MICO|nr:hypothetical protein [Georgenia yuyongxinii]QDC23809.1 hypothetical protein FE374_03435 [Georgenia yuyongxinii]